MRRLLLVLSLMLFATSARSSWNTLNDVLDPAPWCRQGGAGDIYSPFMMQQGNKYLLYFGGFYESCRVRDAIYVADYDPLLGVATNVRTVISPENVGFYAMNDASLVELGSIPNKYWVMYMTGVKVNTGNVTDNKVYLTTSWADDGVNWGVPTLVLGGYWGPGAAINKSNGHVWLWASNNSTDGLLHAFDMGTSGVTLLSDHVVTGVPQYGNIEAAWITVGPNHYWDILAESAGHPTHIDRLKSEDGYNWTVVMTNLVSESEGWEAITPVWDVSAANSLLYGKYALTWPPTRNSIWRARGSVTSPVRQ